LFVFAVLKMADLILGQSCRDYCFDVNGC